MFESYSKQVERVDKSVIQTEDYRPRPCDEKQLMPEKIPRSEGKVGVHSVKVKKYIFFRERAPGLK